jgi:hypothetical protein
MAFSDIAYAGPAFQEGVKNLSGLIEQQRKGGREAALDMAMSQRLLMEKQSHIEATQRHGETMKQLERAGRIQEVEAKRVEAKEKWGKSMSVVGVELPGLSKEKAAYLADQAEGAGFKIDRVDPEDHRTWKFENNAIGHIQQQAKTNVEFMSTMNDLSDKELGQAYRQALDEHTKILEKGDPEKIAASKKKIEQISEQQRRIGEASKEIQKIRAETQSKKEIEAVKPRSVGAGGLAVPDPGAPEGYNVIAPAVKPLSEGEKVRKETADKDRASRESEKEKDRKSREKNVATRAAAPSKTPQSLIESLSKQVVEQGEESLTPNQRAALRLRTGADAKTVSAVENVLKNNINFTGADAETQASMMATTYQLRKNLLGDVQEESKITPRERKFLEDARKRPANKNVPDAVLLEFVRENHPEAKSH